MGNATNEIKNKVVLEGEAQYKKELGEINRALKESKSAMKAAAAEMDGAGDSMVSMYAYGDALERVIRDQEDALRLMGNQLDKVENAYGKNSREAQELRTRINNMRSELAKSRTQLTTFERGMDDAARAMQGAADGADSAESAFQRIGSDAQGASGGVGGLVDMLGQLKSVDLGQLGIVAGIGAGAGKVAEELITHGNEQTQARGQIAAYTGKTGAELDALERIGRNVYNEGFGASLKEASQSVAVVHSYTKAIGTDLEESTKTAWQLNDVFGMDIPESARGAQQLMQTFGLSASDAYALIAAGAQQGADKSGNLLDTINEYSPFFAKAGKSAEEFIGALITGAQNGIYDVDKIGDAMKELTDHVTDGSETTKEALKSLGLESADLPGKFATGGEAASEAFDLIIDSLKGIEDPLLRNQLGVQLFAGAWVDTGGAILDVFDQIGSGAADATGALDALNETRMDDLEVATDRVARRVEERLGEIGQPASEAVADAMNVLADSIDEHGGKVIEAAMDTIGTANQGMGLAAAEAFDDARVSYSEWAAELAQDVASGRWIDQLRKQNEEAKAEAEAVNQTVSEQRASMDAELQAINRAITEADIAGNYAESARLSQEREAIISDIAQMAREVKEEYEAMGTDGAQALEMQGPQYREAGETVTQEVLDAFRAAQPPMLDAGIELGGAGEIGFEAGSDGMENAGSDAAAGAVRGMGTGVNAAYTKGYLMGKAFERGYRDATDTHSPSRVMMAAAEDTTDGLFERFDEDEARLYAAGAALGEAVREGYGAAGALEGAGGVQGAPDLTAEAIGRATVQALTEAGVGFYVDADKLAELTAVGVSRRIAGQSKTSIRGQSSAARSW